MYLQMIVHLPITDKRVRQSYTHHTNCDTSPPYEQILFPEEQPTDYSKAGTTPRLVTSKTLGITDLVASIVDFFTIIEADRFVGVKGSSFSTDLFSVRYYMGKRGNYILGPEGVEELVGPPPPYTGC